MGNSNVKRIIRIGVIIIIFLFIQYQYVLGQQKFEIINGIMVYKSVTKGTIYRIFKFVLTPKNTLLPNDPKVVVGLGLKRNALNYRKEILDEQSSNFKDYGQFEIYIPVEKFPLVNHKSGYGIVRMPQTLVGISSRAHSKDPNRYDYVAEKQALYYQIEEMIKNQKGKVEVILEFPHHNSKEIKRNVYFRDAYGKYIDYIGQLKK